MKDALKGIFAIAVIAAVLVIGGPKVYNLIKYAGESEAPEGLALMDDFYDTMAETPSDIEGWTMKDKLDAGLMNIEGADSDGDGLTDKEEIEVYGSDPTKTSTAGDLYTDGYKVANGMDINTSYEYEQEQVFDGNECSDITLTALSAEDFFAKVSTKSNIKIKGYKVIKAYDLYSFAGELSIDVSDTDEDISVLIGPWHDGDMEKVSTKKEGNSLKLKYDFDYSDRYTIAVVKSESVFNNIKKPRLELTLNGADDTEVALEDFDFLYVQKFFWANLFVNIKPTMYYVSSGDKIQDRKIIAYLLALSDDVTDGFAKVTEEDCVEVSSAKMSAAKAVITHFTLNELEASVYTPPLPQFVFLWSDKILLDESDYKGVAKEIKTKKNNESDTGFNVEEDAFAFQNFSTDYAQGGNCMGIAYYTAQLFNTHTAQSSGSHASYLYNNNATELNWDITSDAENKTLLDNGIHDFKDSSFTDSHKDENGLLTGLTDGEAEYVKMIGAYWAEGNEILDYSHNLYKISEDCGVYSWDTIEQMKKSLDNGNILILSMANSNLAGHAINVVDYKVSQDGETVYFELYDNAYPDNKRKGKSIDNILTVTKKTCTRGYEESFDYYYKPYRDCSFVYSSKENIKDAMFFRVMDHNFNIIE